MSTLKDKAQEILDEKIAKIKPENIKKDIQIFDVTGILDGEVPTLNIVVPESIDIDLSTETQTIVFENTAYIPDVNVILKLYAREKNSEGEWIPGILGNIQEIGAVSSQNDKLTVSFSLWFWQNDIDNYDFKIEMMFVKNNYLPQTNSLSCNLIKPNGAKLQLHIVGSGNSSIKDMITNPNDIVITDENDVVIDNLTKLYMDNYWTDTFIISSLSIGNYKVKLNHNGSEISNMEFSITEDDMKVGNRFTHTLYYEVDGIYKIKGEVQYNNPHSQSEQLLHFAKCKLTRQDSGGQPISEEVQISPFIDGKFIFDGAEQLKAELYKPGYETLSFTYNNAELSNSSYFNYLMTQTFDSATHNSIDIVIGPWENEQTGITSAAPSDLDIDIYVQNDNDEYVKVDENIGYYVSNFNMNRSAVVVFGKMNQNVKLVLNDSRYTFVNGSREHIFPINEWGYTTGLYPVG